VDENGRPGIESVSASSKMPDFRFGSKTEIGGRKPLFEPPCPASACFRLSPSSRHRVRPAVRSGTGPGTDIGSGYPQIN